MDSLSTYWETYKKNIFIFIYIFFGLFMLFHHQKGLYLSLCKYAQNTTKLSKNCSFFLYFHSFWCLSLDFSFEYVCASCIAQFIWLRDMWTLTLIFFFYFFLYIIWHSNGFSCLAYHFFFFLLLLFRFFFFEYRMDYALSCCIYYISLHSLVDTRTHICCAFDRGQNKNRNRTTTKP